MSMHLTSIHLENFKSHLKTEIELKPITILIGPNGCGKSSILQSLLVLKSSLNPQGAPTNPPIFRNESFDLGEYEDVVTNGEVDKPILFSIKGNQLLSNGLSHEGPSVAEFDHSLQFLGHSIRKVNFHCKLDDYDIAFKHIPPEQPSCRVIDSQNHEVGVNQRGLRGINPSMVSTERNTLFSREFNNLFLNSDFFENLFNEFYYVPYNRTATSYGVTLTRGRDEHLYKNPSQMISSMISNLSKQPKLLDKVSRFMEEISGKSIRTRNIDLPNSSDQGVTIDFVRKGFSSSIINEGTGPNQVTLLLYTLCKSPINSLIGIDEPEIHLHPSAQTNLAKIMIGMIKEKQANNFYNT